MITTQDLITRGFRKCDGDANSMKSGTSSLYQKHVRSSDGTTLYFINVWEWDRNRFRSLQIPEAALDRFKFSCETRMYINESTMFDLNLHPDTDTTVSVVERFYASAYDNMKCCPDLHNN